MADQDRDGANEDPEIGARPVAEVALDAALAARDASGLLREGWESAQRHAFATLVFGMTSAVLARRHAGDEPAPDVEDTVAHVLRQSMRMGWRDAQRLAQAIAAALTAERPHQAVQALVRCGWLAGGAWLRGEHGEFNARIVQATASDAFASDRPLL